MAKSPRARDALVRSHINLLWFAIEVGPLTVVPSRTSLRLAEQYGARVSEATCLGVLSGYPAPVPAMPPAPLSQAEPGALTP